MGGIIITGAKSFIGLNFLNFSRLDKIKEVSVYKIDPSSIDLSDTEVVIHLAAIVHITRKIPRENYYKINRDFCLEVARHAKDSGVKQFVFMSTVKVFGDNAFNPKQYNESSICYPTDHYGRSKYEAESELLKLSDDSFTVSIIRTPIVYGPGIKANMLRLIKLIEKYPILPFADVKNKRNYTYVENLVGFIDRIIELRIPGIFIAMDEKPVSTTELVTFLSRSLGRKTKLFKLPGFIVRLGILLKPDLFDRLFGSFELDNSETKKLLGYSPPFTTQEGIMRMIKSYKSGNHIMNE